MRTIKFRAWNKRYSRFDRTFIHLELNKSYIEYHELILMQYTGLKDKNGVEIYEGDIAKINGRVGEIKYHRGTYWLFDGGYTYSFYNYLPNEYKVIGNIYENKELLDG